MSEMPADHSIDLDTPIDWLIAETLMCGTHSYDR